MGNPFKIISQTSNISNGEQSSHTRTSATTEETSSRTGLTRQLSRISTTSPTAYKVYKRRFFGLTQLVLLNIVVSWSWITFAPISNTAATYFDVSESAINWLSTAFLFTFVAITPATFYTLAKYGPKTSIVIAASLMLVGNWVKYAGAKANKFWVVMLGQLFIGFSQPFVLSAPTTYSNVWFSGAGRTSATAVASLANPFGAALGQLISPFWATSPSQVPNCVLYTTIIASVACIPSFFMPARPPTPPAPANSTVINNGSTTDFQSVFSDLKSFFRLPEFYLLLIPFGVLVGFFNAFSTVLNQTLEPYGFSEDDAGIAGALLIFVGLASGAVTSPFMDKYRFYLWYIRVSTALTSLMYLAYYFAPPTRSLPFVYFVCALLGAASFGAVPVVLEFLVEITYPLGPEIGSTILWSLGQLLGGIFIIIMDALRAGDKGDPPQNMQRALVFEAVLAMAIMPIPLCLGLFGRSNRVRLRRWEAEKQGSLDQVVQEEDEDAIIHDRAEGS